MSSWLRRSFQVALTGMAHLGASHLGASLPDLGDHRDHGPATVMPPLHLSWAQRRRWSRLCRQLAGTSETPPR